MKGKTPANKALPPEEPDDKEASPEVIAALLRDAAANPYAHFTHVHIRWMFRIGKEGMRKIVKLGPPQVLGKINPRHFDQWLIENHEIISGVTVK